MEKLLMILWISGHALAQNYRLNQIDLPVFEAGVGVARANLPYYTGGKERRNLTLPFPTFLYRGDTLRADEDGGLRGRFFKSKRLEVNTSFSLSLPVDSDKVEAREGMDDLDSLFEVGPGVIYHIIPKKEGVDFTLSLNLGVRAAFRTDFDHTQYQGVVVSPLLFAWYQLTQKFTWFMGLSNTWSSQKHQAHFYDVQSFEVTGSRPQYNSKGGMFSQNLSSFLIYNASSRWSFVAGVIYEDHANSVSRDSPLHVRNSNLSTLLALTYWFYRSDEKVRR